MSQQKQQLAGLVSIRHESVWQVARGIWYRNLEDMPFAIIANSCDVQLQRVLVKKSIQKLVLRIVTPSLAPSSGCWWIVSFGSCFGFISTRWVQPNQAKATIHDQPLAWCRCESGHSTSRCRQKTMVSLHCRLLARPTVWIWQGVTEWPLYSWVGVLGCTDQWLFLQGFFRENCHVFFGKESISRL